MKDVHSGYRLAYSLSSDAIFFTNARGDIVDHNSSAAELFGSPVNFHKRKLWELLETSLEPSEVLVKRALNSDQEVRFVGMVYNEEGERRAVLVTLHRILDNVASDLRVGDFSSLNSHITRTTISNDDSAHIDDEESCALIALIQDMTDSYLAQQALQRAKQAQKLEAIGQLVSGIAHELNNPLSAVIAYSQLILSNETVTEDERQSIETILSEARRAARIVSNVLTFSRQHRSQRLLANVNRVVEDTLALRQYALTGLNIRVAVELQEDISYVWMDHFQIQQVLLNLINNAEQAFRGCEGPRELKVVTSQTEENVIISVTDTGPGVPPEILDEIFNPFFTTKEVGEGTGLGLAISDGIVRGHGGRISVVSSPRGATFSIELPLPELENTDVSADTISNTSTTNN